MADKLAAYDRSGLRVVHYFGGWRIDVRVGVRQASLDVTDAVFTNEAALSSAIDTLNANMKHRSITRAPVTVDEVRSHSGAFA